MEVALPNGELMRTGMGALLNSTTWQQYGFGSRACSTEFSPNLNFCVVTKMGVWLMPEPEAFLAAQPSSCRNTTTSCPWWTLGHLKNLQILQSMIALGSPLLDYRASQGSVDARRAGRPFHRGDGASRPRKEISHTGAPICALTGLAKAIRCAMGVRQGKLIVSDSRREIQKTMPLRFSVYSGAAGKGDELAGDRHPPACRCSAS